MRTVQIIEFTTDSGLFDVLIGQCKIALIKQVLFWKNFELGGNQKALLRPVMPFGETKFSVFEFTQFIESRNISRVRELNVEGD